MHSDTKHVGKEVLADKQSYRARDLDESTGLDTKGFVNASLF